MRARAFFYHMNRPATQAAGRVQISVHWAGQCHVVDGLDVQVPTASRVRREQPRFVMAGKASSLEVVDRDGLRVAILQ